MGRYIIPKDVTIRLQGKVKFTDDPKDDNSFQNTLLTELIDQAEGQVEVDLSPRYSAPFLPLPALNIKLFSQLQKVSPATYSMIRTLCQLQAVIRILEIDFGRGTAIGGDKYIEAIDKRYKSMISDKLLAKKKLGDMETFQWSFPPLPLVLNYFNTEADDGYAGQVLNTTIVHEQRPYDSINDPSQSWWNSLLNYPSGSQGGGEGC